MRSKRGLLIVLMMVLAYACGGKEVKSIPPEISIADKAIENVYKIKESFEKGEIGSVKSFLNGEIYEILKNQRNNVKDVKLNFKTYWVEVTPERTTVFVEWKATWKDYDDSVFTGSGVGGFVMEGRPPKLVKILRDNPFLKPVSFKITNP